MVDESRYPRRQLIFWSLQRYNYKSYLTVDITTVNASNITVDATGIFLAGGGVFGNRGITHSQDANNPDLWSITVTKSQGLLTITFLLMEIQVGVLKKIYLVCLVVIQDYDDELWTYHQLQYSTVLEHVFDDLSSPVVPSNVTFSVDIIITQVVKLGYTVNINGTFNG